MSTPTAPCHVYTPEWIAEQQRRYAGRPNHCRPRLYRFWTSDEARPLRSVIELWVEALPAASRPDVIARLRRPEQFGQTYNELAVGDSLRRAGHEVEYEPEMDGLTPDWFVRPTARTGAFVVEVASSKAPEDRARCDDRWEALSDRIAELPGNAALSVGPPFNGMYDTPTAPPPEREHKRIVRDVARWLEQNVPEGQSTIINRVEVTFFGREPDLQHVSCGVRCTPFQIDTAPLRAAVKDKAGKYREVVRTRGLPFVVSVVLDFESGRGLDDLQNAVLGEQRCRLVRRGFDIVRTITYRAHDGLFAKFPTLSAVTHAEWRGRQLTHTVLRNASALYPLAEAAFPPQTPAVEPG